MSFFGCLFESAPYRFSSIRGGGVHFQNHLRPWPPWDFWGGPTSRGAQNLFSYIFNQVFFHTSFNLEKWTPSPLCLVTSFKTPIISAFKANLTKPYNWVHPPNKNNPFSNFQQFVSQFSSSFCQFFFSISSIKLTPFFWKIKKLNYA